MLTRLRLDGPDIESLLARVQAEHGSAARIVHAERVRSRGLAGFFAKERFEVAIEVDDAASAADESACDDDIPAALRVAEELDGKAEEPSRRVSTGSTAFAEVLGSITSSLGPAGALPTSDSFVPAPRPDVLPVTFTYAGAPLPVPAPPGRPAMPTQGEVRPPQPPRAPGAILALVGDGRIGYEVARDIARTMRIDPADVLLAAPEPLVAELPYSRRLSSPPEARMRAGNLMAQARPSVVVVDYPMGVDPMWSVDIVDALGATTVWVLVDATRKIADLNRWSRGVRHIDALVVHNAAASDDAGSVQSLGLPVALLDGRLATEAAWRSVEPHRDWA